MVERINEEISIRKRKLSLALADLENYQELADNFDQWLKSAEKSLEAFKTLPLNSKDITAVFAKFEVFCLRCQTSVSKICHFFVSCNYLASLTLANKQQITACINLLKISQLCTFHVNCKSPCNSVHKVSMEKVYGSVF